MASHPGVDELVEGVQAGDRVLLARAITLVESTREQDQVAAAEVLARLAQRTGGAHRVGLSGVPGVGKSTLIERLGGRLADAGQRVAVLAVDPSSTLSGGSILGDKSRMDALARREEAFIRPSPSAATLGGVARRTRESMLLCEAAGFDVVLVETVGVGQSETAVADMVDVLVVLMLPGAGDELQGIKKGILELADVVAVNKTDGGREGLAHAAVRDYSAALHYARPRSEHWSPKALAISALTGEGLEELWELVLSHRAALEAAGALEEHRQAQLGRWMWAALDERLLEAFRGHPTVAAELERVEADVRAGHLTPDRAAQELLSCFMG